MGHDETTSRLIAVIDELILIVRGMNRDEAGILRREVASLHAALQAQDRIQQILRAELAEARR